ncbi:MAG: DUF4321 domain-containing protein [bacterium]
MKQRALLISFIVFGALIGSVMGEIFGVFFQQGGMRTILSEGVFLGFDPMSINLQVIILTLGFSFKFNLLSAIGVILGVYAYRKL